MKVGEVELLKKIDGMLPGTSGIVTIEHSHGCLQTPKVMLRYEEGKFVYDEVPWGCLPAFDLDGLLQGGYVKLVSGVASVIASEVLKEGEVDR